MAARHCKSTHRCINIAVNYRHKALNKATVSEKRNMPTFASRRHVTAVAFRNGSLNLASFSAHAWFLTFALVCVAVHCAPNIDSICYDTYGLRTRYIRVKCNNKHYRYHCLRRTVLLSENVTECWNRRNVINNSLQHFPRHDSLRLFATHFFYLT